MRTYSWLPDLPDHRDFYRVTRPALPGSLPAHVDLRKRMPPVYDQLDIGSCTANAIVAAIEYLTRQAHHARSLSRLFVYYQERAIEHTIRQDAGAMIRDGVKACHQVGVCDESLAPYDTKKFTAKPTKAAYADAALRKISSYTRVTTVDQMRAELAEGFPVVFGFSVFESFESEQVATDGVVNMPGPSEPMLGGHAVLAVGYDDASRRVIVRNSWSDQWGDKGYFTMPYDYVTSRDLSDDFWTIRA